MRLRALSLFSGCAGGDLGLLRAGLDVVAHCEIEPHARAVLRFRFPDVPLHGDVTTLDGTAYRGRVGLVVGGSPCQDLSVAGQRAGLAGARSGLFYDQVRVWHESEAGNILWENVVGALSSNDGRDFACILGAIVGAAVPVPSDGWRSAGVAAGPTGVAAWRVLDLQHFGPPQRRRRVFVFGARVGGLDPEQVLLEPSRLRGNPPARGEARKAAASRAGAGAAVESERGAVMAFDTTQITSPENRSRPEPGKPCHALSASAHPPAVLCVTGERTHALTSEGADASEDGSGRGTPIMARYVRSDQYEEASVGSTLAAMDSRGPQDLVTAGVPRRLTPRECERLQGWPDDWTRWGRREDGTVYELSDSARYRLCGNGIGAPVTHWIGLRLLVAAGLITESVEVAA